MRRFTARDGWTVQACRFALDPSPARERALLSHCGAARVAFNWGLAAVKASLGQREAEKSYGIAPEDLTPLAPWSLPGLRRAWNQVKDQVAPWWAENSREACNTGLDALARALGNWSDSRAGHRKGPAIGFPRFRSRHKSTPSARFTTGTIRVEPGRRARHPAPPRHDPHPREHPQTPAASRRRYRPGPVRDGPPGPGRTVAGGLPGRGSAHRGRPGRAPLPGWTWASGTWP